MSVPELYQEVNRLLTTRLLPFRGQEKVHKIKGRRNTFGFISHRMRYAYPPRFSSMNLKYAELYLALRRLGDAIVPFRYDAITVNQNNICPPHKDSGNLGSSLLVTGGDYEGGSFVIEGEEIETKYNPVVFDGHRLHWNNPFTGMRWSVIYFKIEILPKWLHMFPADVNDPNRDWSLLRDYDGIGAST